MTPIPKFIDNIIIGSGPGGFITGSMLAKHKKNVLILEKGICLKQKNYSPFDPLQLVHHYKYSGVNSTLGLPHVKLIEAEVVGGGSEINSGLYHRTPESILNDWKTNYKIDYLNNKNINLFFEEIESEISVQKYKPPFPFSSEKLIEICTKNNWKIEEVSRWVSQSSINDPLLFQRHSMSSCFFEKYKSDGGSFLERANVISIKKSASNWEIKFNYQDEILSIKCKYLFLCAGTTGTSSLVLKNRLIKYRKLPLHLHPMLKFVCQFNSPNQGHSQSVGMHQITEFQPNFLIGSSVSSLPYLGISLYHYDSILNSLNTLQDFLSIFYVSVPSKHPGTIFILPGFKDPLIRYSFSNKDLNLFSKGLNLMANAFLNVNANKIFIDGNHFPVITSKNLDLVSNLSLNNAEFSTVHLMGSCKMHGDSNRGITNSFGKVYGHDNLYINDASLFCSSIGVNPQGTVMMLAKRNINSFLGNL